MFFIYLMKLKITSFGKNGLHIYIPKNSGYTLGEEIDLLEKPKNKSLTRAEIQDMIDKSIEEAKRGY